jgi:Dissimilatory sulfite reductase (desulfoviridin), alpha and beta subunits
MSTARFHVFSGTGNSRYVAERVAAAMVSRGFATELVEVTAAEIARLSKIGKESVAEAPARAEGDIDVFAFPVYAMALPRIMLRYMRGFSRAMPEDARGLANPRAAVLSTNGRMSAKFRDGHEGQALAQAGRVLRRRGWEVVYRETFDCPHNITNVFSAPSEESCAAMLRETDERIERVAEELAAGRRLMRPCRLWAQLVGWPFGWLYRIFGRRCFGMLFAADERCDGCGLCSKRCPSGAIAMRGGRPAWSYKCEGCERCINLCPKKAIQTPIIRWAALIALCLTLDLCPLKPVLLSLFAFLPGWAAGTLWTMASIVLGFFVLRIIDLVLVAFALVPFLRPLVGFGWTRWVRRYRDPSSSRSRLSTSRDTEAS